MSFWEIYVLGGAVILAAMTALWLLSLRLADSSIVDVFWGPGFVLAGWVYFALADGFSTRKWLLILPLTVWGLRLGAYILWRNWGKGEDYRYQKWREQHAGSWWWRSFFQVFLLQGFLMWLISSLLLAAQVPRLPGTVTALDLLGLLVWAVGFFFEAGGDWQLARFKADPGNRGHVLQSGLWRYTRHPNYFGDALQWWGFFLFSAAAGVYWTIFSPALMTFLLVRISGVRLLEENLKDRKPGYREYVRKTSAFIPWFPRT